jgi:hypothetical protein
MRLPAIGTFPLTGLVEDAMGDRVMNREAVFIESPQHLELTITFI